MKVLLCHLMNIGNVWVVGGSMCVCLNSVMEFIRWGGKINPIIFVILVHSQIVHGISFHLKSCLIEKNHCILMIEEIILYLIVCSILLGYFIWTSVVQSLG